MLGGGGGTTNPAGGSEGGCVAGGATTGGCVSGTAGRRLRGLTQRYTRWRLPCRRTTRERSLSGLRQRFLAGRFRVGRVAGRLARAMGPPFDQPRARPENHVPLSTNVRSGECPGECACQGEAGVVSTSRSRASATAMVSSAEMGLGPPAATAE
jgi:hypothetical protein